VSLSFLALLVLHYPLAAQATINGLPASLATQQDVPVEANFTIGDPNPAAVRFSGSSSDQTLIPNTNILVLEGGASRILVITPAAGRTGTATVTLLATNSAGRTTSVPIVVNVTSPSPFAPPALSIVRPQSVEQGRTLTVQFTVSDVNVGTVTFSATSSDPSVIPPQSISFGGIGATRTMTVTAAANQTGGSIVTINARNQAGLTATREVFFTVVPPPMIPAPTISQLGDLVTPPQSPVSAQITLTDPVNVNTLRFFNYSLNPALVPQQNIVVTGTGSQRTLTITPVGTQPGIAPMIITVANEREQGARMAFDLLVISASSAPILGAIPNLTTSRNTPVATQFSVLDANLSGLRFSATSSNPGVIPNANVVVSGTGRNRVVTVTPAPGQIGNATITLTATAPTGLSSSVQFVVTVIAPPTLSDIPNLTTTVNTPVSNAFTVIDANPNTVRITAVSSNQDLVPNANIAIMGTGTNRTVTVTPLPNRTGTSIITITATNEQGQSSTISFMVTVNQRSSPPTLTPIANITVAQNTPAVVTTTVGGDNVNTTALTGSSSNPTLVPNTNIFFSGTGANRMIVVIPAPNQVGTSVITIVATNQDGQSTSTSFLLTVAPPPVAPSIRPALTLVTRVNTPVSGQVVVNDENINTVSISVASSNPALIPPQNVIVSGFGNLRTVTVTPAPNQIGTAVITLTVRNQNGLTATTDFIVRVVAPPTLSQIGTITIPQNGSGTANFLVTDASPNTITFGIASSNPTLLPVSGITISGAGSARTVSLVPAANLSGQSIVTITATNQDGFSTTMSFLVVVVPPPGIAGISDNNRIDTLQTFVNTPVSRDFTVSDPNLAALLFSITSSNPAVVTAAGVSVTGTGTNRRLTVTPVRDRTGTSVINLSVSNGVASATRTVVVQVIPPPRIVPQPTTPTNGTINLPPEGIDFTWLPVDGARYYHLQVTPDPSFDWIQFEQPFIIGTRATLTGFDIERTYYWRVRAVFIPNAGPWSEVYTFRTGRPFRDTSLIRPGGFLLERSGSNEMLPEQLRQRSTGSRMESRMGSRMENLVEQHQTASKTALRKPSGARLFANVPNPFSDATRVEYEIDEPTLVQIYVVDALGRRVAELVQSHVLGGRYAVEFSASSVGIVENGVYTCVLQTPTHLVRSQMIRQK
jgi:hypothetical protein